VCSELGGRDWETDIDFDLLHTGMSEAKAVPLRHRDVWEERRCSSYSLTTSALVGGELSASRLDRALAPEKEPPLPIVQEAGLAPEPVWTQRLEEKSFASAGD
jgi:hypothetical protein